MASSSASASASTSKADGNCYLYDVFINHRGPDVKKSFASHLYGSLTAYGVRVFLDMNEMQEGDSISCQIEGVIQAAPVHIAIFSPSYAGSKWCLDELVLMLESMQEKGSTIFPVFFGVKPSELRWTEGEKGVYAKALRSLQDKKTSDCLEPRYDSSTIGKWKKALSDVAKISGFDLEECNGNERQLLDKVVQRVLRKVSKRPLDVCKYPTGVDDKVEDFKTRVLMPAQQQSDNTAIVGIVGLGGIGKSTLAKEFFNRSRTNYQMSSFLSDVRDHVSRGSLASLQATLIRDLTSLEVQINNRDEGIGELRKYLRSYQVLVVIDDVDHPDQLDALLPADISFHSGSLILVTSRDRQVLRSCRIKDSSIYHLKPLSIQHSRELFCRHAFSQPFPAAGFEQLVNRYLEACDGLPLSLKVFGALIHGENNLENWEALLRKIKIVPPHDIQKQLKISYDSLDEEEKQIFLDIACFFHGEDKETAIRIWDVGSDGSRWEGSLALQSLQKKCLVEMEVAKVYEDFDGESRVRIKMHDQLRDLGRYLAKTEPSHRIWRATDNLLATSPELEIKSLAECSRPVTERRLHRLYGGCVFSVGQQLIWLHWSDYPYSSLHSWIPMENLRVLQIQSTNLETLWHRQAPVQLNELRISGPRLAKIPESIGQLKDLQQIVLLRSYVLESLPDEFCKLQSLKHLDIRMCSKMKSLPDSFGNLINLQYIKLIECNGLETLPDSFGDLTKLQHIELARCDKLHMLPNSFGNLIRLKFLSLRCCNQLTIWKETLGKITELEFLYLLYCKNINVLPPQLTDQRLLREMRLVSLSVPELPSDIGNLRNLKILELESSCLKMLPPSFYHLTSLDELKFGPFDWFLGASFPRMWTQLKKLSMRDIKNLEQLEIEEYPSREPTFEDFGGEIETSTDLTGQRVPGKLEAVCLNLQYLCIDSCCDIQEIGALPATLTTLMLISCPRLRKIGGLCSVAKLQTLNISHCSGLDEMPGIETLVSLEELRIQWSAQVKRIQGLGSLTKLQILSVRGCSNLQELSGVELLKSLMMVDAGDCPNLPWSEEVVLRLGKRLQR